MIVTIRQVSKLSEQFQVTARNKDDKGTMGTYFYGKTNKDGNLIIKIS